MITREELERDRQDVVNQLNRLQGALSYMNQKIAALDKLKKQEEDSKADANPVPSSHEVDPAEVRSASHQEK